MRLRLTEDSLGTTHLRPWAIPLVVAAICVPVVGAMLLGMVTIEGSALGLAGGAAAVATLLVIAARAKPGGAIEVAEPTGPGRRVLVVTTTEVGPRAAERIAESAGGADDVRLMVPLRSRRIDRWLSAEDRARGDAERLLARSAGALVAAGLPVSGALGDSDAAQAIEDELRGYAADEVILLTAGDGDDPLVVAARRVELPITRIEPH
jgi:hypothetical protein